MSPSVLYTYNINSLFSTSHLKRTINFPFIQTSKPSRLSNVLDKDLIGSADVTLSHQHNNSLLPSVIKLKILIPSSSNQHFFFHGFFSWNC
jgi:hypothetical protein